MQNTLQMLIRFTHFNITLISGGEVEELNKVEEVEECHAPIPALTQLADPNRVWGARPYIGTLYLIFFFKVEPVPMGMNHIL